MTAPNQGAAKLDVVVPAGTGGAGDYALSITPERAGWGYSSLNVLELAAGGAHTFDTGEDEWVVLPLAGSCVVACDGETVGSSRVDLQACKLEYSIVSPK